MMVNPTCALLDNRQGRLVRGERMLRFNEVGNLFGLFLEMVLNWLKFVCWLFLLVVVFV